MANIAGNIFVKISKIAVSFPRQTKCIIAFFADASFCVFSVWLAYYLRLGEFVHLSERVLVPVGASLAIALPLLWIAGTYKAIFRYNGISDFVSLFCVISLYGLIYGSVFTFISIEEVPRTIGIIQPLLLFILVLASRLFTTIILGRAHVLLSLRKSTLPRVLIYGTGDSGRQLEAAITNSEEMRVLGFLDDDPKLHGQTLSGKKIHNPEHIDDLVEQKKIQKILLAIPELSADDRSRILLRLGRLKISVQTLPKVTGLVKGQVALSDLREIELNDLLGRKTVAPSSELLEKNIKEKVVLVTGAGGSIGSELCKQIFDIGPEKLLLVELNEYALYRIQNDLDTMNNKNKVDVIPLLASCTDSVRMKNIFSSWRPDTVYHAAAYKHVPMVEHNFAVGVQNNVFGTLAILKSALEENVKNFVLISTDKAVRPTNMMGATKRLAELILQSASKIHPENTLSIVRFGNVLGSSGSVVPKFREQIALGGPIYVTHPDVNRYFMSTKEAAQLVVQASALSRGGDVFVLDMGKPVKIVDLARQMIWLSGLTEKDEQHPTGDIEIKFSGLRPGEKLFEELLINGRPERTLHPRIMRADEECIEWNELKSKLEILRSSMEASDIQRLQQIIKELVPGYKPSSPLVDWSYLSSKDRT